MFEYKEEIVATRKGCVGSSDAAMLMQVSTLSAVPKSAYERLAVVKGLVEHEDNLHTAAVDYGNQIEMQIFESLTEANPDVPYESNPLWESKRYSRKNVKCIAHPDIVFVDEKEKRINVYEVKTSKYPTEYVRQTYKPQLYYQSLLAKEKAEELGADWRVQMFLVHYSTEGLDLSEECDFDPSRLKVSRVICHSGLFDLGKAMDIIDGFLDTMTADTLYFGEVVEADYLPVNIRDQFATMASVLREIKEREAKVEEFKKKLYDFLTEHGVKKVSCSDFAFTVVEPTTVATFDAKAWWDEYSSTISPEESAEIVSSHTKKVNKKGYIKITLTK